MHTTSINKKWVLITGASSGFGEEFARQYAEQGHSLVLVARRLDRLQAIAGAIRQQTALRSWWSRLIFPMSRQSPDCKSGCANVALQLTF